MTPVHSKVSAVRTNAENLAFDGRYAGVFVAHGDPTDLSAIPTPLGVTLSAYRSPQISLSLVLGAEHPEPVIQWLNEAHERCEGASFLAELLDTGAGMPSASHCHLLRAPDGELDDEFRAQLSAASALVLRLPFSAEVLIICEAEAGRDLCEQRTRLRNTADFGLALVIADSKPVPITALRTTSYDPVGAQATETLRGTAGAFSGNFAEVRRLLRDVFGYDPPAELLAVETEVTSLLARAEQRLASAATGSVEGDVAATALDIAAAVGADLTERLGRLAEQLNAHLFKPDPWVRPISFGRVAESHGLRAVRAVVSEVADRLDPNMPISMLVPVLGERFGSGTGLLGELPFVPRRQIPAGALITYPRRLLMRAGALPVIAGPVVIGTCDLIGMASRLVDGDLAQQGRQLRVRPSVEGDEAREAATMRATIFLQDLVATLACGPAYVYALSRFTPGSVASGPALLPSSRTPSIGERVALCIRLLRRNRIRVHFHSAYVPDDNRPLGADLADMASSLVRKPYEFRSPDLRRVTAALERGYVVDEPPSLVLNALWNAVVRRAGYVNEVALYESLVAGASTGRAQPAGRVSITRPAGPQTPPAPTP